MCLYVVAAADSNDSNLTFLFFSVLNYYYLLAFTYPGGGSGGGVGQLSLN